MTDVMTDAQAEIGAVPRLSRVDLYGIAYKVRQDASYALSWLHPGATAEMTEIAERALRRCAAQLEGLVKEGQPFETGADASTGSASRPPQDERHFETGLRQGSAPPQDERVAG